MAPNQKKASQQRPKRPNWLLACFGIAPKTTTTSTTSNKKPNSNSGGRKRRLFKLCMPKIRVIIIRKKKVIFDSKLCAHKANQSMIMLEAANKVNQLKPTHNSIPHEQSAQQKGSNNNDQHELQGQRDQSDVATCRKQELTPTVKGSFYSKMTKDSVTGVAIMVITLIIMSIWGRLCAILCMSAWLYCVPILRVYKDARPNFDTLKIYMASKFYKKKVVLLLDGLLYPDRKIGIGVS